MEPLGIVIGAALGSAGLSGALAGVVQFSRAARKARLIAQIKASLDGGGSTGVGATTLSLALDRERLRLASISIVGAPQAIVSLLVVLVVSVILWLVVFANGLLPFSQNRDGDGAFGEVDPRYLWSIICVSAVYVVLMAFALDIVIQVRRHRFTQDALQADADLPKLVRRGGRPVATNERICAD